MIEIYIVYGLAAIGSFVYLSIQDWDPLSVAIGKVLWALTTFWLAVVSLANAFFGSPGVNEAALTMYDRVSDHGTLIAASIAASALAWDKFFHKQ